MRRNRDPPEPSLIAFAAEIKTSAAPPASLASSPPLAETAEACLMFAAGFGPRDVARLVGNRKVLKFGFDQMEQPDRVHFLNSVQVHALAVSSQRSNVELTLDQWADYWEDPDVRIYMYSLIWE